jgi:CO/xanthine dehydrogenase FAD-binding subunit
VRNFDYVAPTSLAEAVQAFGQGGEKARALAGGTDIIDQIRIGRRTPELLIDTKRVPEMMVFDDDGAGGVRIGAALPLSRVRDDDRVKATFPALATSAGLIGAIQIQNRATLGGNVGNAAPSGDTIPPLMVLGGTAVIAGPRGTREIPVSEVFAGPGQMTLQPDECLVEFRVPAPQANSSSFYVRFIPRAEMDIAVVGVGVYLKLNGGGQIEDVNIALASVAPTPVFATDAQDVLRGETLTTALAREAGEQAEHHASPISDVRGSADYRRELTKVLTRRAVTACAAQLGVNLN